VGAAYRPSAYHLIPLGYHILDADIDVWEDRNEVGGELLDLLVAVDVLIRFVPDEVRGVVLFDNVQVLLV